MRILTAAAIPHSRHRIGSSWKRVDGKGCELVSRCTRMPILAIECEKSSAGKMQGRENERYEGRKRRRVREKGRKTCRKCAERACSTPQMVNHNERMLFRYLSARAAMEIRRERLVFQKPLHRGAKELYGVFCFNLQKKNMETIIFIESSNSLDALQRVNQGKMTIVLKCKNHTFYFCYF